MLNTGRIHSSIRRTLTLAFALAILTYGAGAALASQFLSHHGMTATEYQDLVDDYRDAGWRLTKVDVAIDLAGDEVFSAIWEPWDRGNPEEDWGARHGMSLQTLEDESATFRDAGFKIVSVCGYNPRNGAEPAFAAIWHYDPSIQYVGKAQLSPQQYQYWVEYYHNLECSPPNYAFKAAPPSGAVPVSQPAPAGRPGCNQYRLYDVDGYLHNGNVKFIAVWYRDGVKYEARHGMDRYKFDWENRPTAYQPANIGAYSDPNVGTLHTKIWNKLPDQVRFSWGHLNGADYQTLFLLKSGQGYCLLDIGSYLDSDGQVKYISLWQAPDPDMLKLSMPMAGTPNVDWVLVNYQDHDPSGSQVDHTGGTWLYNNHNGTDLTLLNFPQMDQGVDVYAAADGYVVERVDGNFDRNTCGITGGTCVGSGNTVTIEHSNGQRTWYTHLRKDSIVVAMNQYVKRGQKIGQIGSSGNSSDAHLHFGVLNFPYGKSVTDGDLVDPFEGSFGNSEYLWMALWDYQPTTLNILDGDTTDHNPTRLEYTERVPKIGSFEGPFDPTDQVWFWFQWNGCVAATDALIIKLLRPDDTEHFSTVISAGTCAQYGYSTYFWTLASLAATAEGSWTWVVEKNGVDEIVSDFTVTN